MAYDVSMVTRIGPRNPNKARLFLKEWREAKSLTQDQLAERIGTTKGTVSRMEGGTRDPNVGYLAAFAEAIGEEEVSVLFRSPGAPTRDELLRGYSNEELTAAVQLIEHSRSRALRPGAEPIGSFDDDRGESSPRRRGTGSR